MLWLRYPNLETGCPREMSKYCENHICCPIYALTAQFILWYNCFLRAVIRCKMYFPNSNHSSSWGTSLMLHYTSWEAVQGGFPDTHRSIRLRVLVGRSQDRGIPGWKSSLCLAPLSQPRTLYLPAPGLCLCQLPNIIQPKRVGCVWFFKQYI